MSRKIVTNTDIPGNSVGSHAAYVRQMVRNAETLLSLEQIADRLFEQDVEVRGITVRFPEDDRPEYLAVIRVMVAGSKEVGFHSAPTFIEVVVGVVTRLQNGSLKFREDTYE